MKPTDPQSLREKKKLQTRTQIADAALRLFLAKKSFEAVTVADVAVAAGVSEKTVFNHFKCKEELVFDLDPIIEDQLVQAIRNRRPHASIVDALKDFAKNSVIADVGVEDDVDESDDIRDRMEQMQARLKEQLDLGRRRRPGQRGPRELFDSVEQARAQAEKLRAIVEEGLHATAPQQAHVVDDYRTMRELIEGSPSLMAYWRTMFQRYEDTLLRVMIEELDVDDADGHAGAAMLASAVGALLRHEMEGRRGFRKDEPIGVALLRGLKTLEGGFRHLGRAPHRRR